CHANLQIVLETFSHAQPASKYSLSNGAETALTVPAQGQQNIARSAGDGRLDHAAAFPGAAADIRARGFPSGS
ncbi:hypothetical protein CN204_36995, partial [Sinorhizobium meliloti]